MKQSKSAAKTHFQVKVDRMAEYLKGAGYNVQRAHLEQACAEFEQGSGVPALGAASTNASQVIPQLGGKSVRLYLDVAQDDEGGQPQFCMFSIDQAWLNQVYDLRAYCIQNSHAYLVEEFPAIAWLGAGGSPPAKSSRCAVSESLLWFSGAGVLGDYDCQTAALKIDKLVGLVQRVQGSQLYVCQSNLTRVEDLMTELGRDSRDFAVGSADGGFYFNDGV